MLHCRYIAAEEVFVHYGGLKQENESEFSAEDPVREVFVKAGSKENIEIPVLEVHTDISLFYLETMKYECLNLVYY